MTREKWLNTAARELEPIFNAAGYELPNFRVSIGFTSMGRRSKRIGECWADSASEDGHFEIFLRPSLPNSQDIMAVLTHELVHAAVGLEAKHGPKFKRCALAVGLEGKMTATVASNAFKLRLNDIIARIGDIPHAPLNDGASSAKPKQSTRLIKCECPNCGYTVRTTKKWIDSAGAPFCPTEACFDSKTQMFVN